MELEKLKVEVDTFVVETDNDYVNFEDERFLCIEGEGNGDLLVNSFIFDHLSKFFCLGL